MNGFLTKWGIWRRKDHVSLIMDVACLCSPFQWHNYSTAASQQPFVIFLKFQPNNEETFSPTEINF